MTKAKTARLASTRQFYVYIVTFAAISAVGWALVLRSNSSGLISNPNLWATLTGLAMVMAWEWYRGDTVRWGSFFCSLAALYQIGGFLTNGVTLLFYPDIRMQTFDRLPVAFTIVSIGFSFMCLSYVYCASKGGLKNQPVKAAVNLTRAGSWASRLTGVAAFGAIALLAYIGFIPILHKNPLSARFTMTLMAPVPASVLKKLIDLIVLCGPMVVFCMRNWKGWTVYTLGVIVVMATANRVGFLFMICAPILVRLLFRRGNFLVLFWFLPIAIAYVAVTGGTLKFGNRLKNYGDVALTALANFNGVGELAYTLDHWNGGFAMGRTYVAGTIPVPTVWSSFKAHWSLSALTGRIAGFRLGTGGLRITGFGEAFLNFGMIGVAFSGILLGWLMAVIRRLFLLARRRSLAHMYLLVGVGLPVFVHLYLSGSGAAWDGLLAPSIVAGLFLILMRGPKAVPRRQEATGGMVFEAHAGGGA